jgi:hypothetical protein
MKKCLKKIEFLDQYSLNKLIKVLIFSQLRYIVFFSQYFFLLKVFNVNISLENAFSAVSLSYLFLFSIPGIALAEPGIRGSLALFFIGFFSDNDFGILSASLTLWILNLAIPSLIGVLSCSVSNKS